MVRLAAATPRSTCVVGRLRGTKAVVVGEAEALLGLGADLSAVVEADEVVALQVPEVPVVVPVSRVVHVGGGSTLAVATRVVEDALVDRHSGGGVGAPAVQLEGASPLVDDYGVKAQLALAGKVAVSACIRAFLYLQVPEPGHPEVGQTISGRLRGRGCRCYKHCQRQCQGRCQRAKQN